MKEFWAFKNEKLEEHIERCLNVFENLPKRFFSGLSKELVREAIVFHDIGKAFFRRRFNFYGHELLSFKVLRNYHFYSGEDEEVVAPYELAVFYHHHPMGVREPVKANPLSKEEIDALLSLYTSYIPESRLEALRKALIDVNCFFPHFSCEELQSLLWSIKKDSCKIKTFYHALFLVILVDDIAAQEREKNKEKKEKEGERESSFFQVIRKIPNYYFPLDC